MITHNDPLSCGGPKTKLTLTARDEGDAPIHLPLIETTDYAAQVRSFAILRSGDGCSDRFV